MKTWESHKNEERGVYEVYGQPGDGRICSIMNGSNEKKHAKLIAAAPELLGALKALVVAPVDNVDHFLRAIKDAERVIAKATN